MHSIVLPSIMAAAYIILGLDRLSRRDDPLLDGLERYFCARQRLKNDLVSVAKERGEGNRRNAVLCVGAWASPERAVAFVEQQKLAYERLMVDCSGRLGVDDPFARLIMRASARVDEYYEHRPSRYHTSKSDQAYS